MVISLSERELLPSFVKEATRDVMLLGSNCETLFCQRRCTTTLWWVPDQISPRTATRSCDCRQPSGCCLCRGCQDICENIFQGTLAIPNEASAWYLSSEAPPGSHTDNLKHLREPYLLENFSLFLSVSWLYVSIDVVSARVVHADWTKPVMCRRPPPKQSGSTFPSTTPPPTSAPIWLGEHCSHLLSWAHPRALLSRASTKAMARVPKARYFYASFLLFHHKRYISEPCALNVCSLIWSVSGVIAFRPFYVWNWGCKAGLQRSPRYYCCFKA